MPLLVLFIGSELLIRRIPNDYSYKSEYLSKNCKEIETLVLGTSHAHAGINPEYLLTSSFNAAHNAQPLFYDFEILKKYDFENLKTIILPITYPTFWLDSESEESHSNLFKNYSIYYHIKPEHYKLKNNFEILSFSPKGNLGRIYRYYLKGKSRQRTSNLGYGEKAIIKGNLETEGKRNADRHSSLTKKDNASNIFKKNIQVLNNLLEYCSQKQIKVYCVTTPTNKHYYNLLDEQQLNTTIDTITEIANKYDNCEYFNYLKDDRFTEEDFRNADHLNSKGAKKFTRIIEEQFLH